MTDSFLPSHMEAISTNNLTVLNFRPGFTNQVLKAQNSNAATYYLPCYIRLKVKDIGRLQIDSLSAQIDGTLLFSFFYGHLDRRVLRQFVQAGQKAIFLQFNKNNSFELRQSMDILKRDDEREQMMHYTIRQRFACSLEGDVFFTPFEIIDLALTVIIQSVFLDPAKNNGRQITIKFNAMDSETSLLIHHGESIKLGSYHLAYYYLNVEYSNADKKNFLPIKTCPCKKDSYSQEKHRKTKDAESNYLMEKMDSQESKNVTMMVEERVEEVKIKHFQYAHFRIPFFKRPAASLMSIFLPLWVLGFINLLVFFQSVDLTGRIGVIATLTLAFIAFVPTINEKIPDTPEIKLVEVLIYCQTAASVLCLIQSLSLKDVNSATYIFVWREDSYFLFALGLNLLTVFTVLTLFLIHKLAWEPKYMRTLSDQKKMKLSRQEWSHSECDKLFAPLVSSGKVTIT